MEHLKAISGDRKFDGSTNSDFALDRIPAHLAHVLREETLALCRSTLTITKVVDNRDGKGFQEAAGWTVTAKLTVAHALVKPPEGTTNGAKQVTDDRGTAHFEWRIKTARRVPLTMDETGKDGYQFVTAMCHVDSSAGPSPEVPFDQLPTTIDLGGTEFAVCVFHNTLTTPPLGTPETLPECGDFDSAAPECPSTGGPEGNGPGGTSPGGDGPGDGSANATTLTIAKTLPRLAHVGERVPVTITVRDVGSHTARDVTVHDAPPGSGHLVSLAGAHVIREPDGSVLWMLGNLRPGASRTIHEKMLITRVARRRLQNTAAVHSANAGVVLAIAVVRVRLSHAPIRTTHPRPPRVTG